MAQPKLDKYDLQSLRNIEKYAKIIDKIYETAIKEAARIGVSIDKVDMSKPFTFKDYPQTRKRIDDLLKTVQIDVNKTVLNGVDAQWDLANEKNTELVNNAFGLDLSKYKTWKHFFNNHDQAREQFKKRKDSGLGLSQKVWNYVDAFKEELEMSLDLGIGEGKSADRIVRDIKQYLNEPDRLFRRVRDKHGNLQLSKNAKAYHPGQGSYRSSYKNARRLAATETNMAYRSADYQRRQDLDFIIGIEIQLSNNHTLNGKPFHCICDDLVGKYPKDFKFVGWHPHCRCITLDILKPQSERDADFERALKGLPPLPPKTGQITDVPQAFKDYVGKNSERIEKARENGKEAYWIRDNKGYVDGSIKETPEVKALDLSSIVSSKTIDNKAAKSVLLEYANMFPEDFRNGIKDVSFRRSSSYMMQHSMRYRGSTNEWIEGSSFTLSTNEFKSIGFNPAEEFKAALTSIRDKKELTFNQEYAIESLWHEILHAKTKTPPRNLSKYGVQDMETVNQFVARKTYNTFLERLGGKAKHQEEVLEKGYGCSTWIKGFRAKLESAGITEKEALEYLNPTLMEDYAKIPTALRKMFEEKSKKK